MITFSLLYVNNEPLRFCVAAQSLSSTIRATMSELRSDLNRSFDRLSSQIAMQHAQQMAALGTINQSIGRTNEGIDKLQSATENNTKGLESIANATNLNNALIAKIDCDSMSLMEDVKYMVYTVA